MRLYPGHNSEDVKSVEGQTYTLNCMGEVGDMLYITDLDYTASSGHNLAEVEIYQPGEAPRPGYS